MKKKREPVFVYTGDTDKKELAQFFILVAVAVLLVTLVVIILE